MNRSHILITLLLCSLPISSCAMHKAISNYLFGNPKADTPAQSISLDSQCDSVAIQLSDGYKSITITDDVTLKTASESAAPKRFSNQQKQSVPQPSALEDEPEIIDAPSSPRHSPTPSDQSGSPSTTPLVAPLEPLTPPDSRSVSPSDAVQLSESVQLQSLNSPRRSLTPSDQSDISLTAPLITSSEPSTPQDSRSATPSDSNQSAESVQFQSFITAAQKKEIVAILLQDPTSLTKCKSLHNMQEFVKKGKKRRKSDLPKLCAADIQRLMQRHSQIPVATAADPSGPSTDTTTVRIEDLRNEIIADSAKISVSPSNNNSRPSLSSSTSQGRKMKPVLLEDPNTAQNPENSPLKSMPSTPAQTQKKRTGCGCF